MPTRRASRRRRSTWITKTPKPERELHPLVGCMYVPETSFMGHLEPENALLGSDHHYFTPHDPRFVVIKRTMKIRVIDRRGQDAFDKRRFDRARIEIVGSCRIAWVPSYMIRQKCTLISKD